MPREWRVFRAQVQQVRRIGPHLTEIAFTGPELGSFGTAGLDQRIKLFLPRPGQAEPVLPADGDSWYEGYLATDPAVRPAMRTYTAVSVAGGVVRIRVFLHGATGPASAWAEVAAVGDRVGLLGPAAEAVPGAGGVEYAPPPGTDGVLVAGDETALPAIAGILAALPAGLPAQVLVEVGGPADELPLPSAGAVALRWLHRSAGDRLDTAIPQVPLPPRPYCWVAGEASLVRSARGHLRRDLGLPRAQVYLGGYWRLGVTEEDDEQEDEQEDGD